MNKTKLLTIVALIATLEVISVQANAFSFSSKAEDTKVEESVAAEATPEVTPAAEATPEAAPVIKDTKQKDPMIKEIEDFQRQYVEESRQRQMAFRQKKAALMQKYKEKILKEDPETLKSYINSCTESSIERYIREKGGYDMDPMMMDPSMMGY